jgi:hypothetical protein
MIDENFKKSFKYNCVGCSNVKELHYIIENSRQISYKTFINNVNKNDMEILIDNLGYSKHYKQGLIFSNDWHISYHKSKTQKGKIVYYFSHSAIEYIFY